MIPSNSDTYRRQLWAIIKENPEYLKSENSWPLMVEWIDRHRIKLGSFKQELIKAQIPTMDTLIRRVREIKEEIRKDNLFSEKAETEEEILRYATQ